MKLQQISLVALAIVLTVTLGLAEPLSAAGPQAAGKKGKSQHRTFSSPNAIVIPDFTTADPYPSTITVTGFKKGKITDVDLRLRGLNHGNSNDVSVLLVAPNGDNAIVMINVGGSTGAASLTLTLDDEAAAPLPDGAQLESGTFQPAIYDNPANLFPAPAPASIGDVALSTFDGSKPNGTWRLFVVDADAGEVGAISGGWDLEITAKGKKHKKHKKH